MKTGTSLGLITLLLAVFLVSPVMAQSKGKGKVKAEKVSGDIGLLDTEKHYMIVVTKQGKLVTINYDNKTKVTALVPSKAKMSDVGLGNAASVQYTKNGEKNHLTSVEFVSKGK
jgi:hypothetical protein